jgi:hypothetical protein
MSILAEFQALIGAAIPQIIDIISRSVHLANTDALSKLSVHCKIFDFLVLHY